MNFNLKSQILNLLPYTFYLILALTLLPYVKYDINSVGISLISIAQQYLKHDFALAINATWSPLFSLLLVPLLALHIEPLLAAKLLQIILGVTLIYVCDLFLKHHNVHNNVKTISLTVLGPLTLYFSFYSISADLLVTVLLVLYLTIISSENYKTNTLYGYLVGIIGGLAYFSRTYAFLFFLLHFALINMFFIKKTVSKIEKKTLTRNFINGILIFLLLSSIWIGLLYQKYHSVMIGSVGTYSVKIKNPIFAKFPEHPLFALGLIQPPNKTAVSIYEDLTYSIPLFPSWSPFSNKDNFLYFLNTLYVNGKAILNAFSLFSILSIPIILLFIVGLKKISLPRPTLILISALIVYSMGYLPFEFVERHIWFPVITFFLFVTYITDHYLKTAKGHLTKCLFIITMTSFLFNPLAFIKTSLFPPDNLLANARQMHEVSQTLAVLGVKDDIASNQYGFNSIIFTYYLDSNAHYFGVDNTPPSPTRFAQLKALDIDYYFFWKGPLGSKDTAPELGFPKIFENNYLAVFKLTSK